MSKCLQGCNPDLLIAWVIHPVTGKKVIDLDVKKGATTTDFRVESPPRPGNTWPEVKFHKCDVTWEKNKSFEDLMTFEGISTFNSGWGPYFRSGSMDCSFYMQKDDFLKMLKTTSMIFGTISGWWYFRRSGSKLYLKFDILS